MVDFRRALPARFRRPTEAGVPESGVPESGVTVPETPPPGFSPVELAAGDHWDRVLATAGTAVRTAWWNDPVTLRHINRVICGEAIDGIHAGFHRRIVEMVSADPVPSPRALSVGCGTGNKEFALFHLLEAAGQEWSFDCYDVSAASVAAGRAAAVAHGIEERLRFHHADAFSVETRSDFAMVYWNNALHHMFDTHAAVAWSRERLQVGGLFAMDDYVGANHFQHDDQTLAWSNRMLALLPDRYFQKPVVAPGESPLVPRVQGRIPVEWIIKDDPSEAVDCQNILPAIRKVFPNAIIVPTGGTLYFIGLNDAFHNFASEDDLRLLSALLLTDEALTNTVTTQYAIALAKRDL